MMKIDPNISINEFRSEMQHRVVRYSLRSLAVRNAVRFAKQQEDPEFYRIATNKIHAQRQFQREMNGPGVFERAFDYLSLGSLREVVITLLLVGMAVFGIDAGRKVLSRPEPSSTFEQMNVDQLAQRLGILLEDSRDPLSPMDPVQKSVQSDPTHTTAEARRDSQPAISDEDVNRIVDAVLIAIRERDKQAAQSTPAELTQSVPAPAQDGAQEAPAAATVSLVSSEPAGQPLPK